MSVELARHSVTLLLILVSDNGLYLDASILSLF